MGIVSSTAIVLSIAVTLAVGDWQAPAEKPASPQPYIQLAGSGICPQDRNTRTAPSRLRKKSNPLPATDENIAAGERLYRKTAKPTTCYLCHGRRGNGNGRLAPKLDPPPRNFTCAKMMDPIPDGQLFWIIQNGSRGTTMPPHKATLSETETWQLIHFIRTFSR
jgi:mono/diheme cytochrome c family protein